MHCIPLTPRLMQDVEMAYTRTAITTADLTGARQARLTCGATQHDAVNLEVERARIGDLARPDTPTTIKVRNTPEGILDLLRATGQTATLDTVVSLVRWTHLVAHDLPLVRTFTSAQPAQSEAVLDDTPHIALERMLQPLATARPGQPVAIGLPYEASWLSRVAEGVSTRTIRILGVGKQGLAASPLHTLPSAFAQRVVEWVEYGVGTNDWNLALGGDALKCLRAYIPDAEFNAEVFFFRDRAIAVANAPQRMMALAIGATGEAHSHHHTLATVQNSRAALTALGAMPMRA